MPKNVNIGQLVLGVVGVLILAVAGYVSVEGISSLSNIEQNLANLDLTELVKLAQVSAAETQAGETQTDTGTPEEQAAAPDIQSVTPIDGATGVAVDATLTVVFDQEVSAAEGWYSLACTTSEGHTAAVTVSGMTYTLDLETDFEPGESCTLTVVAAKVTGKESALPMAADRSSTFTTAAASEEGEETGTAPKIKETTPADEATEVAADTHITIVFDREVTASEGWAAIGCEDTGEHAAEESHEGATYTLDPAEDFGPGEKCTVTIAAAQIAGAADETAKMAADDSFSFVVASERAEEETSESLKLSLPTLDGELHLSQTYPTLTLRLENMITVTPPVTIENITIGFLIPKRVVDGVSEPLTPTLMAKAEIDALAAETAENVKLVLDKLPPTGKYKAWLSITSDNTEPILREYDLEILSEPEDKPDGSSLAFIYPGNQPLVISDVGDGDASVRIGIKNLQKASPLQLSGLELLLLRKQDGGELVTPGLAARSNPLPSASKPIEIAVGEVKYVDLTFDQLPISGQYEAWLVATPQDANVRPLIEKTTLEVVSFTTERTAPSVKAHLPAGSADTLYLSDREPRQVEVRLENLGQEPLTVTVQLVVVAKKEPDKTTSLSSGYESAQATVTDLAPYVTENVQLSFEEKTIPLSGQYEAWLLVTGEKGRLLADTVSLTVSSGPLEAYTHRLEDPSSEPIVIAGVRCWPKLLNRAFAWTRLCQDEGAKDPASETVPAPDHIAWERYDLALWEENLRTDRQPDAFGSELVDSKSGRSGWLMVGKPAASDPHSASLPHYGSVARLTVQDITRPGAYTGTLTLVPTGDTRGAERAVDEITVVAQLRDALWMPFLVIFLGALGIGLLVRNMLGKAEQNLTYQRYLVEALRDRLRRTVDPTTNEKDYLDIESCLLKAEMALALHDLAAATYHMDTAIAKLDRFEGPGREADVNTPGIQIQRPGKKWYEPVSPARLYTDEPIEFRCQDAGEWTLEPRGLLRLGGYALRWKGKAEIGHTFEHHGRYRLSYYKSGSTKPDAELDLKLICSPMQRAARRVERSAFWATLGWAGVAGVAGLLYIDAALPTFGSPLHYLAALAWGLGLSTVALPVEGIAAKLQAWWSTRGKPEALYIPSQDQLTDKTGDEIEKLLKGLGFTNVNLMPTDADKAKQVYQDISPKPGHAAQRDQELTVTLQPKPPEPNTGPTHPDAIKIPEEQDLKDKTGKQIEQELRGRGLKNKIRFQPNDLDPEIDVYAGIVPPPGSPAPPEQEIIIVLQKDPSETRK